MSAPPQNIINVDPLEAVGARQGAAYRPGPGDDCQNRPRPPLLGRTGNLPKNPRQKDIDAEQDRLSRQGQLCGRQRLPYRNRNECAKCPDNGKQWIEPEEEQAFRNGYDWWLWVSGGEKINTTRAADEEQHEPYLSTDPALFNADRVTASAISLRGEFAIVGTADSYVRAFFAQNGSMFQAWHPAGEDGPQPAVLKTKIVTASYANNVAITFVIVACANGLIRIFRITDDSTFNPATISYVIQAPFADQQNTRFIDFDAEFTIQNLGEESYLFLASVSQTNDGQSQIRTFITAFTTDQGGRFTLTEEQTNAIQPPVEKYTCISIKNNVNHMNEFLLAAGAANGTIYFWDDATSADAALRQVVLNQSSPVTTVFIKENFLAAGNGVGEVKVWSLAQSNELFAYNIGGDTDAEIRGVQINLYNQLIWVEKNRTAHVAGYNEIGNNFIRYLDFALERTPALRTLDTAVMFRESNPNAFTAITLRWREQVPYNERNQIVFRMIVGYESDDNTVGLYDWNNAGANSISLPVFARSWRGHTSLPVQFEQGILPTQPVLDQNGNPIRNASGAQLLQPTQMHYPLPGLPLPPSLPLRVFAGGDAPATTLKEWQNYIFGEMRVGRLVKSGRQSFRYQGDLKFYWRAIAILDLRQQLYPFVGGGAQAAGNRVWPPFFWTRVNQQNVSASDWSELQQMAAILSALRTGAGEISEAQKTLWKRFFDKNPQYYLLEYDFVPPVDVNGNPIAGPDVRVPGRITIWKEFRTTVNLKDKWRNIGARRYIHEKRAVGCFLNSATNSVGFVGQGHQVDPKSFKTTWCTVLKRAPARQGEEAGAADAVRYVPLFKGGMWARVTSPNDLVFPTAAQGGFDILQVDNDREVKTDIDGRRLQHFAVRKTVDLLNRPLTMIEDRLLNYIASNHPLAPKRNSFQTNDAYEAARMIFLNGLVQEYEVASNAWRNAAVAEDIHDRRLWEAIAKTFAIVDWQDWRDLDANKTRNWTALHDMYSRTHSFPFYLVDENGVKLQKFCVIGSKMAARKGKSRGYTISRVQAPRSNLFKKNELHVYDTFTLPDKDVELFSEKNIPVQKEYQRPAIAVIQEEIQDTNNSSRYGNGIGPNFRIGTIRDSEVDTLSYQWVRNPIANASDLILPEGTRLPPRARPPVPEIPTLTEQRAEEQGGQGEEEERQANEFLDALREPESVTQQDTLPPSLPPSPRPSSPLPFLPLPTEQPQQQTTQQIQILPPGSPRANFGGNIDALFENQDNAGDTFATDLGSTTSLMGGISAREEAAEREEAMAKFLEDLEKERQ